MNTGTDNPIPIAAAMSGKPSAWPTREAQALAEIGHTTITRPVAIFLVIAFFATLLAELTIAHIAALCQSMAGAPSSHINPLPSVYNLFGSAGATASAMRWAARPHANPIAATLAANAVLAAELHRHETQINESSPLAAVLRPRVQGLLADLGAGGQQVYIGRDHWLFYRPEVDLMIQTSTTTAATSAILQAQASLQRRGITLIIMPIPSKPMIHPEHFAGGSWPDDLVEPPAYRQFLTTLTAAGIAIVDPVPLMLAGKRQGQPQFLERDTHWRPEVMERCAAALAERVRQNLPRPAAAPIRYRCTETRIANTGDLAVMLGLPQQHPLRRIQPVTIHPILAPNDGPWQPTRAANILLIGDSYTNIYSDEALGWGVNAGLAQHLSFHLQRPIDVLAINGSGTDALQLLQSGANAPGANRLSGKTVVIWQFAIRTLADLEREDG